MTKNSESIFINHFTTLLKERIVELSSLSMSPNDFESGRTMAYYEIGALFLECGKLFNVRIDINQSYLDKLLGDE